MKMFRFFLLSFFILAVLWLSTSAQQPRGQIVFQYESDYQKIAVLDMPNGMRQLIFDGRFDGTDPIQSEMNKANPTELTLSYSQHMITSLPLVAKPKHILVVGLGGACIQRYLQKLLPEVTIETAELDPIVLYAARRYFNFQETAKQKVTLGDGRKFIEQSKDKYDIIMLDAFSATSIPYLLSTREFLVACQSHLADGGVLSANLWYTQRDYPDMLKTYGAVFPEWHILKCPDSSNAILTAFPAKRSEGELTREKWKGLADDFEKVHPTGLKLSQLIDRGIEPATQIPADAKILLDADASLHG